ncbi:MAG TPA: hypothetical protein VFU32_05650, partial [Ktedonobacterales bacterium]|nr:hypothetical protein [Ktedonobacterales bacterium]
DKAVPPVKDFPRRSIRPDQVAVPDTAAATAQEDESQQTTSTRNQPLAAARYDLADIQARAAQSLGKTSGRIAPPIDQNSSSGEIAGGGVPPNGSGAGTLVSDEATLKPLLNRSTRSGKPALRQQLSGRLRTWQGRLIFCLFMIAFIFVLGALFWYVIQLLVFLF